MNNVRLLVALLLCCQTGAGGGNHNLIISREEVSSIFSCPDTVDHDEDGIEDHLDFDDDGDHIIDVGKINNRN